MRRIKVLFLAANPSTTARSALVAKVATMLKQLQTSEYHSRIEFVMDWAASIDDLREVLDFHYPHVVHFIGDGVDEGIMVIDSSGHLKSIDSQDLSFLFANILKTRAHLVILHACYMPEQVRPKHSTHLAELVGCVIGINRRIDAGSAIDFATTFYRYVSQGTTTKDAFTQGKTAISAHQVEGPLPELLVKKFYDPGKDVLLPLEEATPDSFSTDTGTTQPEADRTTIIPITLPPVKSVELFVAYVHEDQELLDQLMDHLNLLRNQGLISESYESDVTHIEGHAQILEHLNTAKVILLLISVDFMNSDFIYSSHMKNAIARHEQGEAYVIPILLRPVSWEGTPFSQLPRLPGNNRAITSWADRDPIFFEITQSIRLVLQEQGREPLLPVEISAAQSGPTYPLADVFVTSSIPKVTYVESKDFERLKLTLSQKGRSVVIEGPSGIGKTTAIQKAIEEIQSKSSIAGSKKIEIKSLNARDPDHVAQLNTLDEWHRGTVVIDDFHALDVQLRKKIVDYLKLLADTGAETKKLVIVGIPQSGQKLVDLSFDAANRIGVFQWGKEKDELVLQMIEKGEQALNIKLKHKMELAIMARGSLNVAQFLCFEVCRQERVTDTQPQLRVIDSSTIHTAVSNVISGLALKFEEVTTLFAGLGGKQDSTCLWLLEELAASRNGSLDLRQLKEQRRELSSGIGRFISEKWMETLYKKHEYSQFCFFFDSSTYTLMINDPQLTFYLRQVMPYSKLARDAGIEVAIRQRKVFIGYCKEDDHFLKRLQVHFQPQADRGFIDDLWDDTKLKAGTEWEKELQTAIETATVAILLVSPDFLASDFIWKYQLPRLLAQAEAGGTKIISLIAVPCAFERSKLSVFHPFKFSGRALSEMKKPERERKFTELTEFILNELMREKPQK